VLPQQVAEALVVGIQLQLVHGPEFPTYLKVGVTQAECQDVSVARRFALTSHDFPLT
jgi:hypothetical protein